MKVPTIIILLPVIFLLACENHSSQANKKNTASVAKNKGPNKEDMAGMSGMASQAADHSEMIKLSEKERLLIGIETDTVKMQDFKESVSALGMVAIDESTISTISAKIRGRIDRLYLRNPGGEIRLGDALFDLYSEALLAEEQDLIQLVQSNASPNLISAARTKLKLHGLNDKQVSTIEQQKTAALRITIYSPISGFVSSLSVREGQYVETGEVLFEIASLDIVRVNTQVYAGEIASFNTARAYEVTTDANPEKIYFAKKAFDNPALEPNSKILLVRLRVTNSDHLLRPGMLTNVRVETNSEKVLAIPKTAILIENGMSFTWVMGRDGMFNRRMVQTRKENESSVEIVGGLLQNEQIVTSGIYLLNSEYILRKGANSMGRMKM